MDKECGRKEKQKIKARKGQKNGKKEQEERFEYE
jgi:hypothetical protein